MKTFLIKYILLLILAVALSVCGFFFLGLSVFFMTYFLARTEQEMIKWLDDEED